MKSELEKSKTHIGARLESRGYPIFEIRFGFLQLALDNDSMPEFVTVARVEDVPEGQGRVFRVGGREIAVFRVASQFYALDNVCPHRGGPLGEGMVWGTEVTCPWHAWSFDLRTGAYTFDPKLAVAKFDVRIEDGQVQVAV